MLFIEPMVAYCFILCTVQTLGEQFKIESLVNTQFSSHWKKTGFLAHFFTSSPMNMLLDITLINGLK